MPINSPAAGPYVHPLERIPDTLRRLFPEKGTFRTFDTGDIIMGQGSNYEQICFLMSGSAVVVLTGDNEERITVDNLGPGDIFGGLSYFTGVPWGSDAELVAQEPCEILEISPEEFQNVLQSAPSFSVNVVKNLVRKVIRLDRGLFSVKLKRRALQALISSEEHVFPDYVMGDVVRGRVENRARELARTDGPVLIVGESGVGKEGLAHSIFRMSLHGKEVFLAVDLLGTHGEGKELGIESARMSDEELTNHQQTIFFGHEEAGRDGTVKEIPGYFELTEDGTLLVRGIEQLTAKMQMKLLEALVTQTFRRVGGVRFQRSKVRLFATTRLDPAQISLERHPLIRALMDRGIIIPPLRTRRKEIPGLVKHYLKRYGREMDKDIQPLHPETLKALIKYKWPGNDLELATTLKRAVLVSENGLLRPADIYFHLKRVEGRGKFNLFRFSRIKQAFKSPLYPAVLQSAATPFFFIILAFLFLGPQDPMKNPAALVSWALGWPIIIMGAFVWSRFWCTLCPVGTMGKLAKKIVALERPFPTFLKTHSDFVIAGTVLFIMWFEVVFHIRDSPMLVGGLLLAMLGSAIFFNMVFERQSWCLYLCGLGGMIGVFSKAAAVELRADRNVCIAQCATNECYMGKDGIEGCPFGQAGPKLHSNRLCKLCMTCLKLCPHDAINLNVRLPGQEIWEIAHTNRGTAFLIVGLIGGLFSEMMSGPASYGVLAMYLPVSEGARFTVVFLGVLITANLLLALAAAISKTILEDPFELNYSRYGLSLLPLTLTGFTAFHIYYLLALGVQIPVLVVESFNFVVLRHLIIAVPPWITNVLQWTMTSAGLIWTLLIMFKLGRRSQRKLKWVLLGLLPHALLAAGFAGGLMWAMGNYFRG
ncbi:MAG: sigma 54-interacting transcriptional regulator [Pseudomonadota bacterium]